jgi:hypothetical protein
VDCQSQYSQDFVSRGLAELNKLRTNPSEAMCDIKELFYQGVNEVKKDLSPRRAKTRRTCVLGHPSVLPVISLRQF